MQTNPIGENLLKFYPTDPSRQPQRQRAEHLEHEHVLGEAGPPAQLEQPDQRARVLRQELPVGAGRQQRRDRPRRTGPIDMFNSVTDPTIAALVGVVWNSTLSNTTLLETRFGFNLFSQTIEPNNKIDPKSSASTPVRSTRQTSACPA